MDYLYNDNNIYLCNVGRKVTYDIVIPKVSSGVTEPKNISFGVSSSKIIGADLITLILDSQVIQYYIKLDNDAIPTTYTKRFSKTYPSIPGVYENRFIFHSNGLDYIPSIQWFDRAETEPIEIESTGSTYLLSEVYNSYNTYACLYYYHTSTGYNLRYITEGMGISSDALYLYEFKPVREKPIYAIIDPLYYATHSNDLGHYKPLYIFTNDSAYYFFGSDFGNKRTVIRIK